MSKTYHKPHDYNAICDVCGFKYKATELRLRWDGLRVCSFDWERRPPQDFIKAIREDSVLSFSRPESTDSFTEVNDPSFIALNTHELNTHMLSE